VAVTSRTGFNDAYMASRLNHLTGTTYPSAPTTLYLGIYMGAVPISDGSGGTEVSPSTRPSITLGSPAYDANNRQYITNASAVTGIVLTNSAAGEVLGFGLFAANSGGTPIYFDRFPTASYQEAAGATITIPAGGIRVYAEPPTVSG